MAKRAGVRVRCEVPGCARTIARSRLDHPEAASIEWLCHKHWPLVETRLRRLHSRIRRRHNKKGWTRVAKIAEYRVWRQCVADAIEKAFGI